MINEKLKNVLSLESRVWVVFAYRESNAGDSVFQEGDFCEESIYEEEVDLNGEKIDEINHNHGRINTPEGFDEVVDPNRLARFVMPKRNQSDSEYLDIKKVLW